MANAVDKEQIAMLSDWWKRYGRLIAVAIIVGLVLGLGFRYWSNQKKLYTVKASVIYQSLFNAVGKNDARRTKNYLTTLQEEFPHSVYASLAALLQARLYSERNEYNAALKQLNWVIENGKAFQNFQQIAYIRAVRVLIQQKKYQRALDRLDEMKASAFKPLVDEVRGDVYLAKDDKVHAKAAYEAALAGFSADHVDNPLLKLKLRSL